MTPDIEIVFDPVEEMLFNHLHMNENHEVLPDGEWIRSVRRRVDRDTLFVYYHHKTNKFVLADWCFPPNKYSFKACIELEVFDIRPDANGSDRPSMETLELRCCYADEMHKRMRKKLMEARGLKASLKADSAEQRKEAYNWMKSKGMENACRTLECSSFVGEAEGGERYAETVDELQRMAGRRKIYT